MPGPFSSELYVPTGQGISTGAAKKENFYNSLFYFKLAYNNIYS